ncbi:DUF2019 domain-containing protein [Myxococcus stipitatus]|uniref:DUF2019 domain-containing protein n=1 Tax=Myxococcus stipitatus TaxID=83455 RepID=UPI0030D5CF51
MEIELLVAQFAQHIAAQTDCILRGDSKTGNKHADKAFAAFAKLREKGDAGRDALASLLAAPQMDVRVTAAAFLLRHRTEEAKAVLEVAARGEGMAALGAQQTLKNWENGTWALDLRE